VQGYIRVMQQGLSINTVSWFVKDRWF